MRFLSRNPRANQIGELARAVDSMMICFSDTHRGGLDAAKRSIEESPLGVLQFNAAGKLRDVNRAALGFFGSEERAELEFLEEPCVRFLDGVPDDWRTFVASLGDGAFVKEAIVRTPDGERPLMVSGQSVKRGNAEEIRHFIWLIDIAPVLARFDRSSNRINQVSAANADLVRLNSELKRLMESCLTLLKHVDSGETARVPTAQQPDGYIAEWHRAAAETGFANDSGVRMNPLPEVWGTAEGVEDLFRQALTLVTVRSRYQRPMLEVRSRAQPEGGTVFHILDITHELDGVTPKTTPERPESLTICQAALSSVLKSEDGEFVKSGAREDVNSLIFSLPVAEPPAEGSEAA